MGLVSIPPSPEPSHRLARTVFALSLAVHGSLVWVLHVSASEPVRRQEQIEIELAPPPPPPPKQKEPEPEPKKEEEPPPPPPERVHKPVPRLTPTATPAETAKTPEEVGTDIPQGEDGELPPAPAGLAPPAPEPVVAPPAPPPPPPPPPPVIEAKEGANYLNNPRPAYPRTALREGWQGRVILRVRVLPNGKVESAKVQTSAGHESLDEAALEIVKSWTFVPASQGGKPIAGWVSVPFDFRIQ